VAVFVPGGHTVPPPPGTVAHLPTKPRSPRQHVCQCRAHRPPRLPVLPRAHYYLLACSCIRCLNRAWRGCGRGVSSRTYRSSSRLERTFLVLEAHSCILAFIRPALNLPCRPHFRRDSLTCLPESSASVGDRTMYPSRPVAHACTCCYPCYTCTPGGTCVGHCCCSCCDSHCHHGIGFQTRCIATFACAMKRALQAHTPLRLTRRRYSGI
jgi:hypothetical protein